jgi:hypothetical protein
MLYFLIPRRIALASISAFCATRRENSDQRAIHVILSPPAISQVRAALLGSLPLRSASAATSGSPLARAAIEKEIAELSRYPDGNAFDLKAALASRYRVDATQVEAAVAALPGERPRRLGRRRAAKPTPLE